MSLTPSHSSKKKTKATTVQQTGNTKLSQYIGFFIVGYILASAIFMMVQTKVTLSPQLVTVLSVLAGAYIAVHKFIKHQRRALTNSEMNRLTIASVAVVWLITAIYFIGIWLFLFDAISREVIVEMAIQQPLPLLSALVMILVLTLVSARLGIWLINQLLAPK